MKKRKLSFAERMLLFGEEKLLSNIVPTERPGRFFQWIFKIPILFFRLGCPLFGDYILLLETVGRKSGKMRSTPVEYRSEKATGTFVVVAGWGGRTDWRRNIDADPHVRVQIKRKTFEAIAEPLSASETADWLEEVLRENPGSLKYLSRWAGDTLNAGHYDSLKSAAKYFPSYRLIPIHPRQADR